MANILSIMSTISFVLAALFLGLAVFVFYKYKIPEVYGDLSGKTARKSIQQLRETNEKSGNKSFKPSMVNLSRGKLTETMKQTKSEENVPLPLPETNMLKENQIEDRVSEATTLLNEKTEQLLSDEMETLPLNEGMKLEMIEEVMFIHTDQEII